MKRLAIKAVIFDLDGTLLDRDSSLAAFVLAQHHYMARRLAPAPPENFLKRFLELDDHGNVWKDKVYQVLVREFGITEIGWEELLEDYVANFRRYCTPFLGTTETLASLAASGYKLAIISNGRYPFQLHCVEALGIVSMFDVLMVSEQEGLRKPAAEIFHRALGRLGVLATEAVYVGDDPVADIQGAKRAGLKAVWRPSARFAACSDADAICEDLRSLPEIIHRLAYRHPLAKSTP